LRWAPSRAGANVEGCGETGSENSTNRTVPFKLAAVMYGGMASIGSTGIGADGGGAGEGGSKGKGGDGGGGDGGACCV